MTKKQRYYEEILQLNEAKDFARVLTKWNTLSSHLKVSNLPMVLPDLFWVAKSGVGKTHLLKLLSEYLYESGNLMEFYGNVKYFEFMLDYCPPEKPFDEIHRMIAEVNNAAGFRNIYKGIISVDIEEWLGHCEEKHFITFMEYLSSNSDYWLIVFNVTGDKQEEIKKLESILSMYFRLEKSNLAYPDVEELLDFVLKRLAEYGIHLDDGAQDLLKKTIKKLRENKYFDGYKTLLRLSQDIAYEIFSADGEVDVNVCAEELSKFAPDSDYVARTTWNVENKVKIGLLN